MNAYDPIHEKIGEALALLTALPVPSSAVGHALDDALEGLTDARTALFVALRIEQREAATAARVAEIRQGKGTTP